MVQTYGTTVWYKRMVQPYGTTVRYNRMVQTYGTTVRYNHMVQPCGTTVWYKRMVQPSYSQITRPGGGLKCLTIESKTNKQTHKQFLPTGNLLILGR